MAKRLLWWSGAFRLLGKTGTGYPSTYYKSHTNCATIKRKDSLSPFFSVFLKKLYPVDIYLELGMYAWGGVLNQPSGTLAERVAKAKADPKLFINREMFNRFSAAREVEFEEKIAKIKAASH